MSVDRERREQLRARAADMKWHAERIGAERSQIGVDLSTVIALLDAADRADALADSLRELDLVCFDPFVVVVDENPPAYLNCGECGNCNARAVLAEHGDATP